MLSKSSNGKDNILNFKHFLPNKQAQAIARLIAHILDIKITPGSVTQQSSLFKEYGGGRVGVWPGGTAAAPSPPFSVIFRIMSKKKTLSKIKSIPATTYQIFLIRPRRTRIFKTFKLECRNPGIGIAQPRNFSFKSSYFYFQLVRFLILYIA